MVKALAVVLSLTVAILVAAASISSAHADPASVDRYYSKTYSDCMNAAGGSTMPMRDCIGAEHDDWDKDLNQVYQTRMASRPAAGQTQLRDDERAWLKTTKRKCDHAGDDEAGGTLQNVEIDQCYLDETIRRTIWLRALR
jgi:uncharacterized protein YecT (DUF1311 family)